MPPLPAVALLSAAAIGLEVLLVRAFAILQWQHFAAMVISIALLGYGASGTLLTFLRDRLLRRPRPAFAACAALFGPAALATWSLVNALPLNLLELPWEPAQQVRLLLVYLLLSVPFVLAGTAIGLALAAAGGRLGRIYAGDLAGAGCGALGVVALLFLLPVGACLQGIAVLAVLAAAAAAVQPRRRGVATLAASLLGLLCLAWPQAWLAPQPSPYKELSMALLVPDARIVAERHSPWGQLAVVESPRVPFRWTPGQSLMTDAEPPQQLAVFTDGSGMTAITRFDGTAGTLRYLDAQTAALPFHLRQHPRVLVLGTGGGADVLLARYHQASQIDAVEINPQMVALVRDDFGRFAGNLLSAPGTTVHVAEGRAFVEARGERWDIIQVAMFESMVAAGAGLRGTGESTLFTLEGIEAMLRRLSPGGLLAITMWVEVPPRAGLKVFAAAAEALRRLGVAEPGSHLAWIRGLRTATLLVGEQPLNDADVRTVWTFSLNRGFDVSWLPGLDREQANRFAVLDRPWFYEGATALLSADRERFLDRYKFDVAPATDDAPYPFHTMKTATLLELLRLPERSGFNLVEWGYPLLLATLAQAVVASIVLILLPLAWLRGTAPAASGNGWQSLRIGVYFAALGLAFLFIEITFIQRYLLVIGNPLYAVAAVLAAFLIFAGLGSAASARIAAGVGGAAAAVRLAAAGIFVFAVLDMLTAAALAETLIRWPTAASLAAVVLAIGPLAFCMGLPFPLALAHLTGAAPQLLPWAWAINGCASVISAVLAPLLALHLGFSRVLGLSVALYALAALTFPHPAGRGREGRRRSNGRSGRIRTGDP